MKKICKNCGKELPKDSKFCQYCGSNEIETIENKLIVFKKCADCGKKLPDDSDFCQYCGSKNIDLVTQTESNEVKSNENKTVYKRCIDCGKELPQDSEFCQYCGSKRVAIVNNNQVIKKENITNKNSVDDSKNKNTYKILFFVTLSIALFGILGILTLYENTKSELDSSLEAYQTLEKENNSLQSKVNNYKGKASKYDSIKNEANNKSNSNFFATQTVLKNPKNTRVVFYIPYNGRYEISWEYSSGIKLETGNTSSGLVYADITYSGSNVGTITCTNSVNSSVITIYCISD